MDKENEKIMRFFSGKMKEMKIKKKVGIKELSIHKYKIMKITTNSVENTKENNYKFNK